MNLECPAFKGEGRSPARPSRHLSGSVPEGSGLREGGDIEAGRRGPALLCLLGVGKGEWYPVCVEYRVQEETSGANKVEIRLLDGTS